MNIKAAEPGQAIEQKITGLDYADPDGTLTENRAPSFDTEKAHDEYESQPCPPEPEPEDWVKTRDRFFSDLSQKYTRVMTGGKHSIAYDGPDGKMQLIDQKQLELKHQNQKIKIGEKIDSRTSKSKDIVRNVITAWAEQSENHAKELIFEPNAPEKAGYLNTWRGLAVEPIEADGETKEKLTLINEHIEKIVCAGDPALINYFFNWCAYTFQKPEKQAGAAVVLVGEKGTGKSIIGHFLMKIWGEMFHALHIPNRDHLVGKFNGHLQNVCFVFADEAFFAGDKAAEGVLKSLITEPFLMIERKGFDAFQQKNYVKVFMATNNEKAVPASRDERRYCVFNVSNEKRGERAYFDALYAAIHCPAVQAAFLYEMLKRPLNGFHTGDIPESQGLKEQRYQSLGSAARWLADALEEGYLYNNEGNVSWTRHVNSKTLHKSYICWCDDLHIDQYNRLSQIALGRYLKTVGFRVNRTKVSRLFDMKDIEKARAAFEAFEKISLEKLSPAVTDLSP